jgi:glycosyltransferase involved in cell wall biosynthesis
MRIVHIYKDYAPVLGGIENHVRDLAEAQARAGHDVTVLVTQRRGLPASDEISAGVRVVRAKRWLDVQSAPIAAAFPRLVAQLTRGADIAHLHAPYPIGEACNLLFGRARRTVITWHSDIVRQKMLLRLYAPLLRRVLARADRILPTSEIYARSSPWIAPHWDKCSVAPLGIDPERFAAHPRTLARAAELRAHWTAGASDALVVLSVGRLRYYKGLDDLIRALVERRDVIAVIAGDGPMRAEWQALAESLGVAGRVRFIGSPDDDDLPACFRAADVYALPANVRAEAFGIAVLEAMASALPVVTTEVGSATSWINQDGVTGCVVPARDPAALAAALGRLRDESVRRRCGDAARARVLAEFTRERMVQRVLAAYDDMKPGF